MEQLVPPSIDYPHFLIHLHRVYHFANEVTEGNEHSTVEPCIIASEINVKCTELLSEIIRMQYDLVDEGQLLQLRGVGCVAVEEICVKLTWVECDEIIELSGECVIVL